MKHITTLALSAALLLLAGCGLPSSTRSQIAAEHRHFSAAQKQLAASQEKLRNELAGNPDQFESRPEPARWNAQIDHAATQLSQAAELDRELDNIAQRNRRDQQNRAAELVYRANRLEENALEEARAAEAGAEKWLVFKNDPQAHVADLRRAYDEIHVADLSSLAKRVQSTEQDWPAKKDGIESHYSALLDLEKKAEATWNGIDGARSSLAAGKPNGAAVATLVEASDALSSDAAEVRAKSAELRNLTDQLYTSWDKVLVDLDERDGHYRERIKTVRTHISNADAHEGETSTSEQWVDIPAPTFHAIEDDLGMAIAHKDAGLFDSEASSTPEPAGFAYIAPESVGHNQYGYWDHDHGQSIWTWLPQYLILRELLWDHDYRPVVLDEYRGYRTAQSAGRTYYGNTPATSTPKYGTRGSFTRTTYASSRYVQSGGFKSSGYASHRFNSSPSQAPRSSPSFNERGAGKRFGRSNPGRGFGRSPGRSFGRGFGRGFGRR